MRTSTRTRYAAASADAPAALGPSSRAIVAGGFVFCSVTAGIDPATGTAPPGIAAQTEQALRNPGAVLVAAGSSLENLVETTVYDADVDDCSRLDAVDARSVPDPPPARSAAGSVRLPHGLLVSIEAVALLGADEGPTRPT